MNEFLYKLFFNNLVQEGYLFQNVFKITVTDGVVPSLSTMLPLYLIGLAWIAVSYLAGCINTSMLLSRFVYHDDIRKYGSQNPGTTNMNRTYGSKAGVITLVGDMLKGIIVVLLARIFLGDNIAHCCAFFCILGHCFPVFMGFKGGKGVATAAGVVLILNPAAFLVLLIIFISMVAASRFISLGSLSIAVLYPVVLNSMVKLFNGGSTPTAMMAISSVAIALLLVIRHRKNIKKLLNGTESKFSFRKKGSKNGGDATEEPTYRSLHSIDEGEEEGANDHSEDEK